MKRILLASVCVLSLSCGSDPTGGGGVADEDYFPHRSASFWSYDRVGSVDTLGGEYQFRGRRLETVTGQEEHGGADLILLTSVGYDTLYAAGMDSIFVPIGGVAALKIGDTGVWTYTDTLLTDSILIVQFPLAEGAQWMAHSNPDVYGEVTAMDETITVPEGVRRCSPRVSGDGLVAPVHGSGVLVRARGRLHQACHLHQRRRRGDFVRTGGIAQGPSGLLKPA